MRSAGRGSRSEAGDNRQKTEEPLEVIQRLEEVINGAGEGT